METPQTDYQDLDPLDSSHLGDPFLDSGGLDQGSLANSDEIGFATSGERRPGSATATAEEARSTSGAQQDELGGIRGFFAKRKKEPAQEAPPTRERRPKVSKVSGRRVSSADTLSDAWSAFGGIAARSGHLPLGRCLQFQAPVAGEMLDEAVKGSFLDKRFLQPIVKTRGRFDLISAVMGPPMLVMAIERNPERAEMLLPLLKSSIRNSLPLMIPAIKKVQEKEKKAAEAARELFPDLPEGEDPADAIIALMFADWIPPTPEARPQEAPIFEEEVF